MTCSITVNHIPQHPRFMDDGTSNKSLQKTIIRTHPYRGSNTFFEPSSANHELCCNKSPQIFIFRDKGPTLEVPGSNPSSSSTLINQQKLTKAKSSNASPQNQQDLPQSLPIKCCQALVFIISTSEMSFLSG